MDPTHDGIVVTVDLSRPLARIRFVAANHVQGQKPFSSPWMLCFYRQSP
jgi:hypothetical protein